jgi:protein-S-isoprenylcysteine O-methyltransferase Ste14
MPEFATKLADFLESITIRVRALTVDRANRAITMAGLIQPIIVLVLVAIVFLFMTIHGALAAPLGDAAGFGILAGLFVAGGMFAWRKRTKEAS